MKTDYVYKNRNDTIRVRIFRTESNEWDYDVFNRDGFCSTFSEEAGEYFYLKRDTIDYAKAHFGKLTALGNIDTITEGWEP